MQQLWNKMGNIKYYQQCTLPSRKYTITKTAIVPRHPPPHFQLAAPAIIVLKKLFIILF
jgi:hypothetical protein